MLYLSLSQKGVSEESKCPRGMFSASHASGRRFGPQH